MSVSTAVATSETDCALEICCSAWEFAATSVTVCGC